MKKVKKKDIDYYPEVDPYEEMDVEGLVGDEDEQIPEDFGEEVFSEQEKQIPEEPPPTYTKGDYMESTQQEALENKEIFEKYELPIIETTEESTEETLKAYNEVVKKMGVAKSKLTRQINNTEDSSDKKELKKQRKLLEKESFTITERRNKLKKTGKGLQIKGLLKPSR